MTDAKIYSDLTRNLTQDLTDPVGFPVCAARTARTGARTAQPTEEEQAQPISQSVARPPRTPARTRPAINPDLAELARRGATSSTPDHQLDLQHETSLAPVARAQTLPWTDWELRTVLNHRLREACGSGHPPRNVRAWLAAAKVDELDNEHQKPGWIRKAAAGITAAADGKRITGWRWERGTHAGTFIRDPYGTDTPPRGYA